MESRFGHKFDDVRIHSDPRAAESAQAIDARAYTVGNHIAFSRGQYSPGTPAGKELITHELAHVVQQGSALPTSALRIEPPAHPAEAEAQHAARTISAGGNAAISSHQAVAIQRDFSLGNYWSKAKQTYSEVKSDITDAETALKEKVVENAGAAANFVEAKATEIKQDVVAAVAEVKQEAVAAVAAVKKEGAAIAAGAEHKLEQAKAKMKEIKDKTVPAVKAYAKQKLKEEFNEHVMGSLGTLKGVVLEVASLGDTVIWLHNVTGDLGDTAIKKTLQQLAAHGVKLKYSEDQILSAWHAVHPNVDEKFSLAGSFSAAADEGAQKLQNLVGIKDERGLVFTEYELGELKGAIGIQVAASFVGVEEVELVLKGVGAIGSVRGLIESMKQPGWETSLAFWTAVFNVILSIVGLNKAAASKKLIPLILKAGAFVNLVGPMKKLYEDYTDPELAKDEQKRKTTLAHDFADVVKAGKDVVMTIFDSVRQGKGPTEEPSRTTSPPPAEPPPAGAHPPAPAEHVPTEQTPAAPASAQQLPAPAEPAPAPVKPPIAEREPASKSKPPPRDAVENPQTSPEQLAAKIAAAKQVADAVQKSQSASAPPAPEPSPAPSFEEIAPTGAPANDNAIPKPTEPPPAPPSPPAAEGPPQRPAPPLERIDITGPPANDNAIPTRPEPSPSPQPTSTTEAPAQPPDLKVIHGEGASKSGPKGELHLIAENGQTIPPETTPPPESHRQPVPVEHAQEQPLAATGTDIASPVVQKALPTGHEQGTPAISPLKIVASAKPPSASDPPPPQIASTPNRGTSSPNQSKPLGGPSSSVSQTSSVAAKPTRTTKSPAANAPELPTSNVESEGLATKPVPASPAASKKASPPIAAGIQAGSERAPQKPTYVVDEAGMTVRAEGEITGSHRGRGKGYRPEPAGGRVAGEHRGHLIPEGGVDNPTLVNVRANMISEASGSNLGPKKVIENFAIRLADQNPGSIIQIILEPQRSPGQTRPFAVTVSVLQDGQVVKSVSILNK
jgi:hypothetical protein